MILLDWSQSNLVSIKSLVDRIGVPSFVARTAKLKGCNVQEVIQRDEQDLHVDLPESKPGVHVYVPEIN